MRAQNKTAVLGRSAYEISCLHRSASSDLAIFLHGLGCSKRSFEQAFVRPELRDMSLLAFDMVGFGDSDKPETFSYDLGEHAAVCEAVIRRFRKPRFHIVAHSMGGAVGLLLAGLLSNQLISFISVEGTLFPEDVGGLTRRAAALDFAAFTREPALARPSRDRGYGRFLDLERSAPLALYRSARSLAAWADSGRLPALYSGLVCAKAYLYGERDADLPALERIPAPERLAFPDSGHFPMNENPEAFYPLLGRLLRRFSRESRLP